MRKHFDEYFAKVVLEYCFPERYRDLAVRDKPDLQGKNVGIEVTNCTPKNVREGFALCRKVVRAGERAARRDIERIEQLKDVQITPSAIVWDQGFYSNDLTRSPLNTFLNAVEKKLEKLNRTTAKYADFEHYDLFVNSALDLADSTETWKMLPQLSFRISQLNIQARKFEFVYLATINQSIAVFDLNQRYAYIKHLYNRLNYMAEIARDLWNGAKDEQT